MLEELLLWRAKAPYAADSDYIFASAKMKGKQPFCMSRIMQHNIKPVAASLGIPTKGWHTLRYSYTTLLRQNGNNPKVVQDVPRHATYSITANIYDATVSDENREAHRGVLLHLVTRTGAESATLLQVPDLIGVPDGI